MRYTTKVVAACLSLLAWTTASRADDITLQSDEAFSGLKVTRFEGRDRLFTVSKADQTVEIKLREVKEIRFDQQAGVLVLDDDSVYSGVRFLGYDGNRNRFLLTRLGREVEIRATEIKHIEFSDVEEDGLDQLVQNIVDVPVRPVELRPALMGVRPVAVDEEASVDETETGATDSAALPVPAALADSESGWFEDDLSGDAAFADPIALDEWGDDELYENTEGYVGGMVIRGDQKPGEVLSKSLPRWKGGKGSSSSSRKSSSASSSSRSRPAPKTRTSSSRSRRPSGASDRAAADADASRRSSDNRSSSSSRSSRSSSSRDRDSQYSGERDSFQSTQRSTSRSRSSSTSSRSRY